MIVGMRAIVQERYGGPEVLGLRDVEVPGIRADEVLVRVHAASVHPDVWHVMRGRPAVIRVGGARRPRHRIPGTDLAGVVEAAGRDVRLPSWRRGLRRDHPRLPVAQRRGVRRVRRGARSGARGEAGRRVVRACRGRPDLRADRAPERGAGGPGASRPTGPRQRRGGRRRPLRGADRQGARRGGDRRGRGREARAGPVVRRPRARPRPRGLHARALRRHRRHPRQPHAGRVPARAHRRGHLRSGRP